MGLEHTETALGLIAEYTGSAFFAGPKGEGLVSEAERLLGFAFSPSYRRFLSALGAGSIGGEEFYGITKPELTSGGPPNGIAFTLDMRGQGLAEPFVVVYDFGDGSYGVLDMRRCDADGEAAVRQWFAGVEVPSDQWPVIAPDFGSFFLEMVSEAVA